MKYICACLSLLVGLSAAVQAAPKVKEPMSPLKEARQRWLHGSYEEAREKYEALLKDDKLRAPASVGLSRAWESEGKYEKALEVVESALKDLPRDAGLLARQAEIFYLRGRWDDAETAAEKALKSQKDHFLARWIRAQIHRDRGNLKKADAEFRWFVRTYSERSEQEKDIKDPEDLVIVALAAAENARWHSLSDQFDFILKEVYADAVKYDKDYWPAEYNAGLLLLEKQNAVEALEAFDKALAINASAAEVLVARGSALLQQMEPTKADNFALRALKVNPRLPEALRLRADVFLMAGDLAKALTHLERARQVNPRDETTLATIAACHLLREKKDEFDALVKQVAKFNSLPGVFYAELAERLEARRRYDEAESYYKKAMKYRPMLAAPQASLGMLYMRMAREKEARTVLDKAFKMDDFNVRVSNTLKVLKHLDDYDKLETKHFLIRFDPKHDQVLARFMAKSLEEIYDRLAKQFDYRPKGPILIEVFNNHHMFSGRTIALPDLHTIGACTGRLITMCSPRDKAKIVKKFNWGRVLRHELVHIFNLEQTNFQVPHWYTEGLAVSNEGFPRSPTWNNILVAHVPDKLLNLGNIDLAFIRPRSPTEWTLAYLQGQLYVEYMKKTHGAKSVGQMLEAFRQGLSTPAAIKKVCKVSRAEFEKGYREYLKELVKKIKGKAGRAARSFKELEQARKKAPEDLDVAAELAEKQLLRGNNKEALKLSKGVLRKKKNHPLASYVQAELLRKIDLEVTLKLLEGAADRDHPEVKVVKLLGEVYLNDVKEKDDAKKYAKAAEMFELARKLDPYDHDVLVNLARSYAQTKSIDKLIDVLKELVPTDPDDLATRKRLAEYLLKAGRAKEAERFAREALEIDVLDRDAQEILQEALHKQMKAAQLKELLDLLGK
jgi:tetratricopeptide (TPR) repeat protein